MKLIAIVLFSLSVVLLIIGLHQIMMHGFAASYWIIMFATFSFLGYGYIKTYKLKTEDFMVNSEYSKKTPAKLTKTKKR